ncbi:uncharacterized protein LOC128951794 [Oppia nitens]|uniref:uncharacterized protein LOC128951794 n=1 Tax=Oppia nitens TaxID=1686743 RepID=UPI0023DAF085|nr:uncharacterized protein LOC128951794 [Oppia nitens]
MASSSSSSSSPPLLLSMISLLVLLTIIAAIDCLHTTGVWSPSADPMKVMARFGVGKSDPHHKEDSYGYVFGNVSKHMDPNEKIKTKTSALLLVNRQLFLKIYSAYNTYKMMTGSASDSDTAAANNHSMTFCRKVFDDIIGDKAYDQTCATDNKWDIMRFVPCADGGLCEGAIKSSQIVQNYQFTYVIEDQTEPTFWFLLLMGCYREEVRPTPTPTTTNTTNGTQQNITCHWKDGTADDSVLKYDVWLVNGHPSSASNKLLDFDHQFSFEQQDLLLNLLLVIFYIVLTAAQLYAFTSQKIRNLLSYLFTISLSMHCLSDFFLVLHKIVFAHDGQGFEILNTVADIIRILSLALFILFVMIIAKGWPVTKPEITAKPLIFVAWLLYIIIEIILFIWIRKSLNTIEEIDEYHTFPGWISLGFRVILMMWFLYELRLSMMLEQDQRRLKFYLHFGAGILVWFVHLPLVAMVALQIELMWRYKLISGFSSAADFLAYAIVAHLMWPTRQNHHFLTHQSDIDYTEELEYYDDSTLTNSESFNFTNANYRDNHHHHHHQSNGHRGTTSNGYTTYDNHISCDIKA